MGSDPVVFMLTSPRGRGPLVRGEVSGSFFGQNGQSSAETPNFGKITVKLLLGSLSGGRGDEVVKFGF